MLSYSEQQSVKRFLSYKNAADANCFLLEILLSPDAHTKKTNTVCVMRSSDEIRK